MNSPLPCTCRWASMNQRVFVFLRGRGHFSRHALKHKQMWEQSRRKTPSIDPSPPASLHTTSLVYCVLSDLHLHFTSIFFFALFSNCPDRSPSIVHSPIFSLFIFLSFSLFVFFRVSTKSQVRPSFPHLYPHDPFSFPLSVVLLPKKKKKKKKKNFIMTSSDGMSTFLRLLLLLSLSAMSIANAEYRSYNGTGNNRANPLAGSAWTPFLQNHTIAKTATYPEQQQSIVAISCPISPPPANSWAAGRCVSNIAMSYDTPVNNTVQRQEFVSTTFRTHMVRQCFFTG
ncbi:MAG: hypothetical protein BYD32DRAFT_35445 [Podila humilis]|nr:MAG: hypothetical protein BYD32DRAFT_35445 [Podila humilis]